MEKAIHESSGKEHILLTSLGMRAIETEYEWKGKTVNASPSLIAVRQQRRRAIPLCRVILTGLTEVECRWVSESGFPNWISRRAKKRSY